MRQFDHDSRLAASSSPDLGIVIGRPKRNRDWRTRRLEPILTERPTQRALMLMADLEEAETGDHGRARGWLARAIYAPRDPVWTADGVVLEEWAPVSPVTGKLDAVEWKVPVAEIEGPKIEIDKSEVRALPPAAPAAAPAATKVPAPAGSDSSATSIAEETVMSWPPRGTLAPKAASQEPPKPAVLIQPPHPDDPGVRAGDESEERRSPAL